MMNKILFLFLIFLSLTLNTQAEVKKSELQIGLDSEKIFEASIRIIPAIENNKLIGFEVFTVNQNSIFNSINLLPHDILTHINNTKLTSQNIRGLIKSLAKSKSGSYVKINPDENYKKIETKINFKIDKKIRLEKITTIKYNIPFFSNQNTDSQKVSVSNNRDWKRFEVDKIEKLNIPESIINQIDGFKLILEEDYILDSSENKYLKSFAYLDDHSPLRKIGLKAFDKIISIDYQFLDKPLSKKVLNKVNSKKPIIILIERQQKLIRLELTPIVENILTQKFDLKKKFREKLNQVFFPSKELLAKINQPNSKKAGEIFEELYLKTFHESSVEKYISKNININIPLQEVTNIEKLAENVLNQILAIPVYRKSSIVGYKIIRVGKNNILKTLKLEDNDILMAMNEIKVYKDDEFFKDIIGSLRHRRKGYIILRRNGELTRIRYTLE